MPTTWNLIACAVRALKTKGHAPRLTAPGRPAPRAIGDGLFSTQKVHRRGGRHTYGGGYKRQHVDFP